MADDLNERIAECLQNCRESRSTIPYRTRIVRNSQEGDGLIFVRQPFLAIANFGQHGTAVVQEDVARRANKNSLPTHHRSSMACRKAD